MDIIDQRLTDLYGNWQAEYRDAMTLEECEENKEILQTIFGKV